MSQSRSILPLLDAESSFLGENVAACRAMDAIAEKYVFSLIGALHQKHYMQGRRWNAGEQALCDTQIW